MTTLYARLRHGARRGSVYTGPHAYCTDYAAVPKPGFYALTADGKQLAKPLLRLVAVDDAPGQDDNGAWHLEIAGKTDPPQKQNPNVHFEAHAHGQAETETAA